MLFVWKTQSNATQTGDATVSLKQASVALDKASLVFAQQGANMSVCLYPSESERLSDLVRMQLHSDTAKRILHSSSGACHGKSCRWHSVAFHVFSATGKNGVCSTKCQHVCNPCTPVSRKDSVILSGCQGTLTQPREFCTSSSGASRGSSCVIRHSQVTSWHLNSKPAWLLTSQVCQDANAL